MLRPKRDDDLSLHEDQVLCNASFPKFQRAKTPLRVERGRGRAV